MEIALDFALQCSPDHPYVKTHPEWFKHRPDGTIQYAENPPKKYQDIYPFNFASENNFELWQECKKILLFWIKLGVKIFRVDNPHTKPFAFWQWLLQEIKSKHPDVIFLSEAFTRPSLMYYLAKIGFTQSYTYFTWRNTKAEFIEYLTQLTQAPLREYFRPNFWPNTPDILPEHLQGEGRPAFIKRFILAATLSTNYGIYGPAFELCINLPLKPGGEEYLNSEKYQIINWNLNPITIKDIIKKINHIRKSYSAFHTLNNLQFLKIDNDQLLAYWKKGTDYQETILIVVNLNDKNTQSGWLELPISEKIDLPEKYTVQDLLTDNEYPWTGDRNYIELNPYKLPAHIFRFKRNSTS